MWLVAMPRRAEEYILLPRSSVQAILRSLAEATSVLEKAAPFVPEHGQLEPADETEAPEDIRKGRSKGKPRDASRSRDRRGQSKGGTSGSSLGLPRKGNNKGRRKDKDAPPSKTPWFYKSRFDGEECERWASFRVWMRGTSSSPKERAVCATCGDWLFEPKDGADPLADYYGTV